MTPPVLEPVVLAESVTLSGELDVAGRLAMVTPDTGIARTFDLPRARATLGADLGHAGARVRIGAVRSTTTDGYFGIDGEAWVAEVDIAEAILRVPEIGLVGSAGMVRDVWNSGGEASWGHGAVWAPAGEAWGWSDRSDLGGTIAWNGLDQRVGAAVSLVSGEGANWRERNEGKDLAGLVAVAPFGDVLRVSVYARNGSRGLGLARNHRLGARVDGEIEQVAWGVEVLQAWGVNGDATRAPLGGSAWATVTPWGPLVALGRLDLASEDLGAEGTGTVGWLGAAGVTLDDGAVDLLLGAAQTRRGEAARAVAGADALASETRLFLQLDVHLVAATRSP